MSMTTFGVVAVVQGRQGGWPGQSTWTDSTQCYIVSPVSVDYGLPFGVIQYSFAESFTLPSNPSGAPIFVTLFDPHRTGNAAIFVELSNTKFNDPTYVRLGVIVGGTAVGDWTNPTFGASGANHSSGIVPDPGSSAGSTKFLCEDASWAVPSGGGGGAVTSVFTRTGAVVATSGDYSVGQVTGAAPLASPALTGVPTAPTAANGTNTTQVATTAFVLANAGGGAVLQASVEFTAAQLIAMTPAARLTIVPAPGTGKALIPIAITLQYKFNTTPFTLGGGAFFNLTWDSGFDAWNTVLMAGLIDQSQNMMLTTGIFENATVSAAQRNIENNAFVLYPSGTGLVSAGDGSLSVSAVYYVMNVS